MKHLSRPALIAIALAATIGMNLLANILPLNGRTTGEISDQFMIFVTPAGYVFSIWSLIYTGMLAYVIWQFTRAGRASPRLQRIGVAFVATCIANIVWLELWHFGFYRLTLAAMLVLLAALVFIYRQLHRIPAPSDAERWCVDVPFSLYLGWVTVATLVNLSVVLDVADARPFGLGAREWAIWMIVAAGLIGLAVGHLWRDLAFQAVVVWATIGIALKDGQAGTVATTAAICATIVALHALVRRIVERFAPGASPR